MLNVVQLFHFQFHTDAEAISHGVKSRLKGFAGLVASAWLGVIPAMGQLEVAMSCVQVNDQGYATVTWTEAIDPGDVFQQYVIHVFEPSSGLVLETFNIPNPTDPVNPAFVNTTYNAGTTELCYFVLTEGPAGTYGPTSDTLCSIHLTADPALTPGVVDLNFNSPRIGSNDAVSPEPLLVQLQDADGNWNNIASIADNGGMMSAAYELEECSGDLLFRVTQSAPASGCDHVSNATGSQLSDELDPDPPVLTAVQVDYALQEAVIEWEPSTAEDLAGYIIYQCNGGFQMAIDTVFDPSATFYVHLNSNVQSYIESYNVAAFDSCYIGGEPDPGAASPYCASSLFLNASTSNCSDVANLTWAGAFNLSSDIAGYSVWIDQETPSGSGNWLGLQEVATLGATTHTWQHTGALFGSSYRYHIVAETAEGTNILSNVETAQFSYPGAPAFTSLRRASVSDSGAVNILVDLDPNSNEVHDYTLQRRITGTNEFTDLETQQGIGGLTLQFIDYAAKTDERSYAYRVRVENYCGDSVGQSNTAETVWLRGISDFQLLKNTLHWTPYADFPGATAGYRIYRKYNLGNATELLISLPNTVFTWEDDVSSLLFSPGDFCYIIEATDALPGPAGGINYAFSNELCLTQEPVIWIPNAILVGGVNDVFKPVVSFADFTNYRMEIQNRWGDVMYETFDIDQGWDGSHHDQTAPEGAYGYFITIQDGAGKIYERQGLVHLLNGD